MSTHSSPTPTTPTSVVRNTAGMGKKIPQENLDGSASDAALREYCDKHYNQLLPILAEKMHQEKLKAVKALSPKVPNQGVIDLNHQGRKVQKGRRYLKGWRKVVYSTGILRAVTKVPAREEQNLLQRKKNSKRESSRRTKALSEGMDSAGGHWKSRSKRQKSSVEEVDLS
ncbi:hypothetical protein Tco_0117881 [Tanacetum coccineum]